MPCIVVVRVHVIMVEYLTMLITVVGKVFWRVIVLGVFLVLFLLCALGWFVHQVIEIAVVILVFATELRVVTLPSIA